MDRKIFIFSIKKCIFWKFETWFLTFFNISMFLIWLKVFQKISNVVTFGARSAWLRYRYATLMVCFVIYTIRRVERTSNHDSTTHSRWEKCPPPPKRFRCGPGFKKKPPLKIFFWWPCKLSQSEKYTLDSKSNKKSKTWSILMIYGSF